MASQMKIRAQIQGAFAEVKVLINHPMESGFRKDESGNIIPAHYIETVKVSLNEKPLFKANWGPAISRNPFLGCRVKGAKAGDTVSITWVDNKGDSRTDKTKIT